MTPVRCAGVGSSLGSSCLADGCEGGLNEGGGGGDEEGGTSDFGHFGDLGEGEGREGKRVRMEEGRKEGREKDEEREGEERKKEGKGRRREERKAGYSGEEGLKRMGSGTYHKVRQHQPDIHSKLLRFLAKSLRPSFKESFGSRVGSKHGRRDESGEGTEGEDETRFSVRGEGGREGDGVELSSRREGEERRGKGKEGREGKRTERA